MMTTTAFEMFKINVRSVSLTVGIADSTFRLFNVYCVVGSIADVIGSVPRVWPRCDYLFVVDVLVQTTR